MLKKCFQCQKEYKTKDHRRKFCSNKCYWKKSSLLGNKSQFKKGKIPWNKGVLGLHQSPATEFKKGQKGIHWVKVGTIKKRKCKGKKERSFIKIEEPTKWEELAKYVWKSNWGKIIKGDVVHHIDGNSLNDDIDNLIAFPRADHPIFHSRWGIKKISVEQHNFYLNRYKRRIRRDRAAEVKTVSIAFLI